MADDFVAVAVGDGVLVRASEPFVLALQPLIAELTDLLDHGVVPPGCKRRLRRTPTAESVLRRMFPDASASGSEADAFWARHRTVLIDSGPAWRVRKRCAEPTPWLVGFDEVDDWLFTFAQLRGLYLTRADASTAGAVAFSGVQEALVVALEPGATTGWLL